MSPIAPAVRAPLRAVSGHGGCGAPAANARHLARGRLRVVDHRPRVIVAGGGPERRRSVREHVRATLGDATVCETTDLWSVLAQAPTSHLVILTGDLAEASAHELERLLAHRHPKLKVLRSASEPQPEPDPAAEPEPQLARVARLRPPAAHRCADAC